MGVFADRIRTLFCALALRFPDATLDQVKTLFSCIAAAIAIFTAPITHGADGAPERIRILYASTALSFSPIWIANDLGIYRKHGLDAEAVLLGGGPLIASVLLSGSAEVGIGAGDAPIRVALQGGDMKIFALQKHARILSIVSKPSIQELSQIKVLGIRASAAARTTIGCGMRGKENLPTSKFSLFTRPRRRKIFSRSNRAASTPASLARPSMSRPSAKGFVSWSRA